MARASVEQNFQHLRVLVGRALQLASEVGSVKRIAAIVAVVNWQV